MTPKQNKLFEEKKPLRELKSKKDTAKDHLKHLLQIGYKADSPVIIDFCKKHNLKIDGNVD